MISEINTPFQLKETYPEFSAFIDKMFTRWMLFLVDDKADELPASHSFVKHFIDAIPNEETLRRFVDYANAHSSEEVSAEAFACWVIFVGNEELAKFSTTSTQ
jgi:hypothetical protein